MFGLHAAVAVPLQSTFNRSVAFVSELFLPKDCHNSEAQKHMLNAFSSFMQQACRSLHMIVDKELEEEVILPVKEMVIASDSRSDKESWIVNRMEAQQMGKGVSVSRKYKKEEPKEEFKVTTHWEETQLELYDKQVLSDFGHVEGGGGYSSSGGHCVLAGKKAGDKKRKKMEKTISLQDLRQYFAGSLKDAAKSIGVCPTTLKRICRQHGITRWPSRKIKKVGHSLRKLQVVIDSVQGAEGAIQIGSFYSSFPELSNGPPSNLSMPSEPQLDTGMLILGAAAPSKSPSSSSSQSSGSSTCCSTGAKQQSANINSLGGTDGLTVEDPGGTLKSVLCDAEFQKHPNFETQSPILKAFGQNLSALRVKAMFGEVKIIFMLQPSWGFIGLQQEIAKRFNIKDISRIDLKYLDDDEEWILLTCDADLHECIDIYKSSQSHTIRISLHQASNPSRGSSFGST